MKHSNLLFNILLLGCLLFLLSACGLSNSGARQTVSGQPAVASNKGSADDIVIQGDNAGQDGAVAKAKSRRYYEQEVESIIIDGVEVPVIQDDKPLTPQEEQALLSEPSIRFDLDPSESAEMQLYFKYFTRDHRATFERWLERAQAYLPYVRKIFAERGLPEELIYLPFAESGFNPFAYSWAGAGGMWQFMPYTGKLYGLRVDWWVDERRSPDMSTRAAADYLSKLYGMFGDWYLALAAYNAGEGKISRAMTQSGCDNFFDLAKEPRMLAKETQHYVPKFLAILKIVHNLEALGFRPINWEIDTQTASLEVKGGTDLQALAKASGLSWTEFQQLNPIFRRPMAPPDRGVNINLPVERLASARNFLDSPDARPFASLSHYKVAKRDSMAKISKRFGVPTEVLARLNPGPFRVGQDLMIPSLGQGADAKMNLADNSKAKPTKETDAVIRQIAEKRANYMVRKGDTAYSLSRKFNVGMQTLLKANGMSSPKQVKAGTRLFIPDQEKAGTRLARMEEKELTGKARIDARNGKSSVAESKAAKSSVAEGKGSKGHVMAESSKAAKKDAQVNYQVRNGDTLYSIAQRFGVTPEKLIAWNNIPKRGAIRSGDNIVIFR